MEKSRSLSINFADMKASLGASTNSDAETLQPIMNYF